MELHDQFFEHIDINTKMNKYEFLVYYLKPKGHRDRVYKKFTVRKEVLQYNCYNKLSRLQYVTVSVYTVHEFCNN